MRSVTCPQTFESMGHPRRLSLLDGLASQLDAPSASIKANLHSGYVTAVTFLTLSSLKRLDFLFVPLPHTYVRG
jgi:hypothetical protein